MNQIDNFLESTMDDEDDGEEYGKDSSRLPAKVNDGSKSNDLVKSNEASNDAIGEAEMDDYLRQTFDELRGKVSTAR
jgi:hypothetical protein